MATAATCAATFSTAAALSAPLSSLAPAAELTYQEFMRRAADTANGREQRIKAKLQEARSHRCPAPSFADATRPIANAQVHDAYKKVRRMRSAAANVPRWRCVRAADASPRRAGQK
jgi:hypothetical protein